MAKLDWGRVPRDQDRGHVSLPPRPRGQRFDPTAHNTRAAAVKKRAQDEADAWIASVRARKAGK